MIQSVEELKSRQAEFEKALEQKEAEKLMIYQVAFSLLYDWLPSILSVVNMAGDDPEQA